MACKVFVMPAAIADLEEHYATISSDSILQANKWLTEARDKIFSLETNPSRFALIPEKEELGEELRDFLHYSHRVVYRIIEEEQKVEILRFYHSSRRPLSEKDIP